jgi:hypothetical protein
VDNSETGAKTATVRCSFCEKSKDQVAELIAGPNAYICDECIDLCNDILHEGNLTWGGVFVTADTKVTPEDARIAWDLARLQRRLASSADLLGRLIERIESRRAD